ncbi:alpha/beta fold hydrolase [Algoriphagus boritolerans]|uniref:Alpha/beta hydrolase fold n=1 Tax=Algoriphagus boritolerans DSM 17298 = JCM 18970 TaxID=1120964 RepID=A0A1H5UXG9_9BACT|nr:alpha/beta hydrolase [Algoriphagus boritolerans]SEF78907.1 alpha/beta hydrolase fold [Algoriphagus boritolerans DSM 17298 = JCM 18970]
MQKIFILFFALLFTGSGLALAQKQSKTIQIDGKSQHYLLTGIKNRKLGQPLIIIESGLGANLEPWDRVISELPENTPIFAYDRAGNGQSEAFDEIPTPANRTKQLKALLDKLELTPPYILVGQEWGGILIKHFASTYPQDIEAMIYIDPINRSMQKQKMVSLLDKAGLQGERIAAAYFKIKEDQLRYTPQSIRSEAKVILDLETGEISNTTLYDYPRIPSVIIAGGMKSEIMFNPSSPLAEEFKDLNLILQADRIGEFTQQTMGNSNSEMVLVSQSAQFFTLQEPEKLASIISLRYFNNPSNKIGQAAKRYSPEEFREYLDGLLAYFPEKKIPESLINGLGYDQLRRDQPKYALVLFQYNVNRFPDSANVYDSMGDGLVALGKVKEAVPYFEKAVELGEMSKHRDLGLFKKNLASAKELK